MARLAALDQPREPQRQGAASGLRQLRPFPQAFQGHGMLGGHPRLHMHFTPNPASWLDMAERFFRGVSTGRLVRGVFHGVPPESLPRQSVVWFEEKPSATLVMP